MTTGHPKPLFMSSSTGLEEILVTRQPNQAFLRKKNVFSWETLGFGVSPFPWTYD